MESKTIQNSSNPLETESIWKLMRKFAVPAIITGLVNSLYNIVDQIFIGQSIGTLGNAATNVAFPLVIILTAFGMMKGAAIATVIGQIVSAIVILVYFRHFRSVPLKKKHFLIRKEIVKGTAALGMAACLTQLAVTVVQIVLNNALGHYGELSVYGRDIPLAAVGVVSKVSSVFTSVMFGIAQSCQPIMGFNYGTGNYKRVRKSYQYAATIVLAVGIMSFLCFQIFPRQILDIFGQGDALYYEFGTRYFRVFLFFIFVNGLQVLTSSFFSSIGKAVKGTLISLSRQVLLFLPLVLILPMFFGIDGVLYSGPITDGLAFLITIGFYYVEVKKFKKQEEQEGM